ncbi:MAG: cyclic nucleotide-binding domain-containing protein [Candidatus Hydrogenedentes bacterium]|nr:cyclic nucleotide-binding domain-containing protein [Candidatus Hydrogenedentota bacterium]
MPDKQIEDILAREPFSTICPDLESARVPRFESFGTPVSIYGILQNDARIRSFRKGEFVLRKDDYGNSAFYLLNGALRAVLSPNLPDSLLGHREPQHRGVAGSLLRLVGNRLRPRPPEYRFGASRQKRQEEKGIAVSPSQLESILDPAKYQTVPMKPGVFFGEIGAIYRMPRELSILAAEDSRVLEIRWQGLRDLMGADEGIARHIDRLYRERSLRGTLDAVPEFRNIPDSELDQVQFYTYGKYDEWSSEYIGLSDAEKFTVIEKEEVIAREGDYANGVLLLRAGFARESREYGHGHQTLNYMTTGHVFGLREALYNWQHPNHPIPLQHSLRAIGYTHVIVVPTRLIEEFVLPQLPAETKSKLAVKRGPDKKPVFQAMDSVWDRIGPDMFEFFAEHRLLNGTKTMLIDLNRCTRCDDCVRACAGAHDENPRFVRNGPVRNGIMVANACMHCADPVCMIGCPTGAISRESHEGRVVINEETCIGCATCYSNCPYDAIRMAAVRNRRGDFVVVAEGDSAGAPVYKATKCDFCHEQPGGPSCVRACPHDALARINMQDANEVAKFVRR